jgi:hypothetical protein
MAPGAVISGATRGRGGAALGRHLADRRRARQNEDVRRGATRGIVSEEIEAAIAELTRIVSHARSKQPLYHVHLDPELPWTEQQHERYWQLLEGEFELQNQPFVEAIHIKHGRAHDHRVYSRVRRNGTIIPLKYDYARREKLSRIVEYEFGGRHIAGRHNRAVAAALKKEGRLDVLRSIEVAGLTSIARPVANVTPDERHQFERTGMDSRVIASAVFTAWRDTGSGEDFIAALARQGLRLAMGNKTPVLIDLAGGAHSLTRLIGKASAAAGARIKAKEIQDRIANIPLPLHHPEGTAHHDENQTANASRLDTSDHYPASRTRANQIRRLARRSSENRRWGRRLRVDRARIGQLARDEEYRRDESFSEGFGDTAAGGKGQIGQDTFVVGGHRRIEQGNYQRPRRTQRATGRGRAADYRIESILDEPEFQSRIDSIVAWTALLDPGAVMRQRAEEIRAEMILNEPEFALSIKAIEVLALFLVRLLTKLLAVLFGAPAEHEKQHVGMVAEKPFDPSPPPGS